MISKRSRLFFCQGYLFHNVPEGQVRRRTRVDNPHARARNHLHAIGGIQRVRHVTVVEMVFEYIGCQVAVFPALAHAIQHCPLVDGHEKVLHADFREDRPGSCFYAAKSGLHLVRGFC